MKTVIATFLVEDDVAEKRLQALLNDMNFAEEKSTSRMKFVGVFVGEKVQWKRTTDHFGMPKYEVLE